MKTLGNILWHFPCFGFLSSFFAFLLGSILTCTLIASPIGLGLLQYSKFLLAPFSYDMIDSSELREEQDGAWKTYSRIVWFCYLPIGCLSFIVAIVRIAVLCIIIVGIPVALVMVKALGVIFNPVGKICVPRAVGEELQRRKDEQIKARYFGYQDTTTDTPKTAAPMHDPFRESVVNATLHVKDSISSRMKDLKENTFTKENLADDLTLFRNAAQSAGESVSTWLNGLGNTKDETPSGTATFATAAADSFSSTTVVPSFQQDTVLQSPMPAKQDAYTPQNEAFHPIRVRTPKSAAYYVIPILLVIVLASGGSVYYLMKISAAQASTRAQEIVVRLSEMQQAAISFFKNNPDKMDDFDFRLTPKNIAARSLADYLSTNPNDFRYLMTSVETLDVNRWYVGYNLNKEKRSVRKVLEKMASNNNLAGNITSTSAKPAAYQARNAEIWLQIDIPKYIIAEKPQSSATLELETAQTFASTSHAVVPEAIGLVQVSTWLNLRASPNASAPVIAQIPNNYLLPLLETIKQPGEDMPWYRTNSETYGTGWVYGQFIRLSDDPALLVDFQKYGEKNANAMFLKYIDEAQERIVNEFINKKRLPTWLKTEGSIELVPEGPLAAKLINGKNVNVRSEPHTSATVLIKLNSGKSITALAVWNSAGGEQWYFVSGQGFREGWIHGDYIRNK